MRFTMWFAMSGARLSAGAPSGWSRLVLGLGGFGGTAFGAFRTLATPGSAAARRFFDLGSRASSPWRTRACRTQRDQVGTTSHLLLEGVEPARRSEFDRLRQRVKRILRPLDQVP